MVWINGAKRKILRRYAHLCENIEKCALPNIRESNNPNLRIEQAMY